MRKVDQIRGLHHVTSLAADAQANNAFFTRTLGLRRVKKTVNFDAPDVYHLYYGDEVGTPGSVMTYFPFPHIAEGRPGTGEVGTTVFSVPQGALGFWKERFGRRGVDGLKEDVVFGKRRTCTLDAWRGGRRRRDPRLSFGVSSPARRRRHGRAPEIHGL